MIQAVAYRRCSTTKQDLSLDGQSEAIRDYAAKNGYQVMRWYEDDGISGSSGDERPAFQKMVKDAESNPDFQAILVYDLSRFGRMDSDETGHYRYLLKNAGISIVCTNEHDGGNGAEGEIFRTLLQTQKRQLLFQISRDTLRGQTQSVRKGWASGRAAPYGLDRILVDESGVQRQRLKRGEKYSKPKSWHISLAPSDTVGEADNVRWMFDTYLRNEVGCREIARQLDEKGVPSPHGGNWCLGTVRSIFKNPIYKGNLAFGRRGMGKFHRLQNGEIERVNGVQSKGVVLNPESDWIVAHKPEMALVTADIWDAVNAKLTSRGDRSVRARAGRLAYPLSGLVHCGDCQATMVGMNRDKSYQIYACGSHFRNKACHSNTVRQEALLALLRRIIKELTFCDGNKKALRASILKEVSKRPECHAHDVDQIKRELNKAKESYGRAAENMLAVEPEHMPVMRKALNGFLQKTKSLEAQLQTAQSIVDPNELADTILARSQMLLEVLFSEKGDRLKSVLGELVEKVELRFDWGLWGNRKVRTVVGGDLYLKSPATLTVSNRGDRI